jgi:hypothetical protein
MFFAGTPGPERPNLDRKEGKKGDPLRDAADAGSHETLKTEMLKTEISGPLKR